MDTFIKNLFLVPFDFSTQAIFQPSAWFITQQAARFLNISTGAQLVARPLGHLFHDGLLAHDFLNDANALASCHLNIRTNVEDFADGFFWLEQYGRKPAYFGMIDGFIGLDADSLGSKPNLIPNGNFEAGADGWLALGGEIKTVRSRSIRGAYYLKGQRIYRNLCL